MTGVRPAGRVCAIGPGLDGLALASEARLLRPSGTTFIVDSRGALGRAERRRVILDELSRHVAEVAPDVLGGVANSGSTWGVLLSERNNIDFVNILVDGPRSKGLGRQLEPDDLVLGRSVLLVDNWVESGASLKTATSIVTSGGGEVIGALCVSASLDHAADVPLHIAFPYGDLLTSDRHLLNNNKEMK